MTEELTLDKVLRVQATDTEGTFDGVPGDYPFLGVYGGHFLGQALSAGFRTVADNFRATLLHALFLQPGKAGEPITYKVRALRNGKRSASRQIDAYQPGSDLPCFTMMANFGLPAPADNHTPAMPDFPGVEALRAKREAEGIAAATAPFLKYGVEVETGKVWSPTNPDSKAPKLKWWNRAAMSAAATAQDHQCALAYLSDGPLVFTALRPHGVLMESHFVTSMDHAVWFYEPTDAGAWSLYDAYGPVAGDSRGFNHGDMFTADGRYIARVAQQGLMRRL